MTTEIRISARPAEEKPKYKKTTAALLERGRLFFQDPENERAYQEWKAGKDGRNEQKAAV